MTKAYSGIIVLADILLLIVKMVYFVLESIYRTFVPVEEKSVAGEIVLVTGAGHGIGRQLTLKYATLGATVVCWDINSHGNEETVKEVKKLGLKNIHAYKCDVSNREEVFAVAEKVRSEVGDVTILVNNAGIMPCHSLLDHKPEEIQRIFNINVLAHFWILQAFLPSMIENNYGHIVALSSMAGIVGLPNLVPYCASKFAVKGMMEALHEEVRAATKGKQTNIKFTTLFPYMVDTGLCKNPKIKFPSLMGLVSPKEAAAHIVRAQRGNFRERSVPAHWLPLQKVVSCLPEKFKKCLVDFVDAGVHADC